MGMLLTLALLLGLAPAVAGDCAPKPTVVLVHGAWAGTSSWSGETERLQRAGYVVRVWANPLRGLTADAAGSALSRPAAMLYDQVGPELYLKRQVFAASFGPDLPPATAQALWAGQRPAAMAAFSTPSAAAAWEHIPSWYVIGTADRIITPASQEAMARRAHAKVRTVPGGSHLTLVSHPDPVTEQLLAAAEAAC